MANVVRWRWLLPAVTAMSGWIVVPQASAAGFIDDSTLTGGIYYWQRERDRKDVTDGDKYKTNLSHSTRTPIWISSPAIPLICLVLTWLPSPQLKWRKAAKAVTERNCLLLKKIKPTTKITLAIRAGISLYKAAAKFKYGPVWARGGYIQPTGQTLLAPHWSFYAGYYRC